MEQLTPELERRLQVEELWARRNVLADAINARRRERFYAQHAHMTQFGTVPALPATDEAEPEAPIIELVAQQAAAKPQAVEAVPKRKTRHAWLVAVPAMAAAILLAVTLAPMTLGLPHALALSYPAAAPHSVVRSTLAAHNAPTPDLKTEVAARIAAAMAHNAHSPQDLQALQSWVGAPSSPSKPER
jgi:hypothetical protein